MKTLKNLFFTALLFSGIANAQIGIGNSKLEGIGENNLIMDFELIRKVI